MNQTRIATACYGSLIAVVLVLSLASQAAAEPPSWDKQINNKSRFKVLDDFDGAAVLDRETGLVWEQSPDAKQTLNWFNALIYCSQRAVGGRRGWRLPAIEELASLEDPNNPGGDPDLPPGHPFSNVMTQGHWSATTDADFPVNALYAFFGDGEVDSAHKTFPHFAWCVRGGQGIDGVVQ